MAYVNYYRVNKRVEGGQFVYVNATHLENAKTRIDALARSMMRWLERSEKTGCYRIDMFYTPTPKVSLCIEHQRPDCQWPQCRLLDDHA